MRTQLLPGDFNGFGGHNLVAATKRTLFMITARHAPICGSGPNRPRATSKTWSDDGESPLIIYDTCRIGMALVSQ